MLVAAAAGGAGWAVAELARPRRVDIRAFDPDEVARLETAMWRSYYDRRRLPLFGQLVALLQGQFHLQPLRAVALAGLAARAAAVFQVGAGHDDYRRALPYLERYYRAIRAVSETPFDPGAGGLAGAGVVDRAPRGRRSTRPATWRPPWPTWPPSSTRCRPSASGPTPPAGPRP